MKNGPALLALVLPALALADYGAAGPLAWTVRAGQVNVGGTNYPYDLYVPDGSGPWPIVAIAHGYSNGKENYAGYGKLLASRGTLVVLPQFPIGSADYSRLTAVTLASVDEVVALGVSGGALAGKVDGARQAVAGHSMGGLIALMVAAQRTTMKAAVLLDPVENGGLGAAALAQTASPTLILFAEPAFCNATRNAAPWYAALSVPKAQLTVTGSSHCDPQDPINASCAFGCSGSSQSRAVLFERYAVAWLQYFLQCDAAARASIDGADFSSDKAASKVGEEQFSGLPAIPCATATDAGTGDAGAADAGGADSGGFDAGSGDAGSPGDGGGQPGLDGGSGTAAPPGCGCSGMPAGALVLCLAALLLLTLRKAR